MNTQEKKVSQYSLEGRYLGTYRSIGMASKQTRIPKTSICAVCRGRRLSANGYLWRYGDTREIVVEHVLKTDRKVSQYTKEGKWLKTYLNCAEAARQTGLSQGNIWSCAAGARDSLGGSFWRFTDLTDNLFDISFCQCCGKEVSIDEKVIISVDCLRRFKNTDKSQSLIFINN